VFAWDRGYTFQYIINLIMKNGPFTWKPMYFFAPNVVPTSYIFEGTHENESYWGNSQTNK
jgi:hypothetical protein